MSILPDEKLETYFLSPHRLRFLFLTILSEYHHFYLENNFHHNNRQISHVSYGLSGRYRVRLYKPLELQSIQSRSISWLLEYLSCDILLALRCIPGKLFFISE